MWIGESENLLLQAYGSPSRTYRAKDGIKILTYTYSNTSYERDSAKCQASFFINKGIVIDVQYGGNFDGCDALTTDGVTR